MEVERAREIAASSIMAHVTFHGTPVYIEKVDENNKCASIHPIYLPENSRIVPLDSLIEH